MGRVAVATKHFKAGEVVLKEPPALVFESEGRFDTLWDSFLSAAPKVQAEVLEMQSITALDTQAERSEVATKELLRYCATSSHEKKDKLEKSIAADLVEIATVNSHLFYPSGGAGETQPKSALYTLGSKLEHSCAPNTSFETTSSGMLEYVAEMQIFEGERVSTSYQSHVYEESRQQRREGLKDGQNFICECRRCMGFDECSPFNCDICKERGTLFHHEAENEWACVACEWKGCEINDGIRCQIEEQHSLSRKLDDVKTRLETRGFKQSMVLECCIIQNVVASKFSRLHWLHPKALHSIRVVATSSAGLQMKKMGYSQTHPSVVAMLQLSGKCQLDHFLWLQRNIALVHGSMQIVNECQNLGEAAKVNEKSYITRENIENIVDSIISNKQDMQENNTQVASLIFYGGLDLLFAGHNERVALLFKTFQNLFNRWSYLDDEHREKIHTLVESKGATNPFTMFSCYR